MVLTLLRFVEGRVNDRFRPEFGYLYGGLWHRVAAPARGSNINIIMKALEVGPFS